MTQGLNNWVTSNLNGRSFVWVSSNQCHVRNEMISGFVGYRKGEIQYAATLLYTLLYRHNVKHYLDPFMGNLTAITIKLTANTDLPLQTRSFFFFFFYIKRAYLQWSKFGSHWLYVVAILTAGPIFLFALWANNCILYKDVLNTVKECRTGSFIIFNAGLLS